MSDTRPILAQLHRGQQTLWKRHYASLSNAARRAVELAMLSGEPGDVIEFSWAPAGLQIGTAKLSVNGQLVIEWVPAPTKEN